MEKFNKKTLIIGLLIFIGLFFLVVATFGQSGRGSQDLNPPQNLNGEVLNENDVNLFWTQPSIGDSAYLHWDSGENEDQFGFLLGGAVVDYAAKWDPEHITIYDGWTITKIRFFVVNPTATIKLKIWEGEDATEIYSQDIPDYNIWEWTEITLDEPVTVNSSTQLWAGLNIDMEFSGTVMGTDNEPAIIGYGNLYRYNGEWYQDFTNLNWNIQIQVEKPETKETDNLLGYNVYRDDEQLNEGTWTSNSYVDGNLLNNTYEYYVTAVYDDGESVPSNTVTLVVEQAGILVADSMALVDLYNECNGPNWMFSDLWLVGPVSEWFGITTTDTRVTDIHLQTMFVTGDLPESMGDLTALKTLWLESNSITSIPESIGNLTELEELWLGWNSITSIPESIGNLSSLRQLHLGLMDTPLGTLPESLGNLVNLEWLALGDAGLNSLPESFGNLTSVESCFLWGNNLTELPAGFGGMESLSYLTLDDNQLTTLPESFGDLDNLSRLFMENNQLVYLPESFGDLQTLDSLWARYNQIAELPESFGDLDDLNFLRLEGNMLTELPVSFTNLATIKHLFLYGNQLNYLPEDFGNMNTIVLLDVGENNLVELPESIGELSLLEIFAANGNSLTAIPESFGNLEPDSVFIHKNQIAQLPASLFDNTFDIFTIHENNLQFGSIEPFMGNNIAGFWYSPQAMIGKDSIIDVPYNQIISYTIEVSGEDNVYKWYKDGSYMPDQTTNTLYIENASNADVGVYVLKVTNTTVVDLELVSYDFVVSDLTDVLDLDDQEIKIYPNPVSGNAVNISLNNPSIVKNIVIMNISGQVVGSETNIVQNTLINIRDLNKGIYIVKIGFENGQYKTEKLVVK